MALVKQITLVVQNSAYSEVKSNSWGFDVTKGVASRQDRARKGLQRHAAAKKKYNPPVSRNF